MQLQCYVIPGAGFPAAPSSSGQVEVATGTLNCVLQASGLPQGRSLEVSVNDTLKKWQEGSNQTFSWELQQDEEIRIAFYHDTAEVAFWRGLWKGDALFSLGALPVRVFFNGVEQPRPERDRTAPIFDTPAYASSLAGHGTIIAPPPEAPSANGQAASPLQVESAARPLQRDGRTAITEGQQEDEEDEEEYEEEEEWYSDQLQDRQDADDSGEEEEEYRDDLQNQQEDQLVLEQDQLVLAEEQQRSVSPFERETTFSPGEGGRRGEGPLPVPPAFDSSSVALPQEAKPAEQATGGETPSLLGKVAAFYADPARAQKTLQQLTDLLAKMPRKTVIVDLRESSRAQKKEEYHPLSRSHLRDTFGGRYWDRSRALTTTYRTLPQERRTLGKRWERIIAEIENPDGLPALEHSLRAGYSMILMDSIRLDEESIRRVVVNALRERLPGLQELAMPH